MNTPIAERLKACNASRDKATSLSVPASTLFANLSAPYQSSQANPRGKTIGATILASINDDEPPSASQGQPCTRVGSTVAPGPIAASARLAVPKTLKAMTPTL